MNTYYERKRGFVYELCQNRFKDNPNHPHNVCAIGRNHKELVEMYEKYLSGGVDWLDENEAND